MQSLGQALEIEVFDKDEGNDDDELGRWVPRVAGRGRRAVAGAGCMRVRRCGRGRHALYAPSSRPAQTTS